MGILLVCVGVGLVIGIIIAVSAKDKFSAVFFSVGIGAVVGLALNIPFEYALPTRLDHVKNIALISMRNGNEISGSFFLGCGTVDEKTYYYYYASLGNGRYVLEKKATESAVIIEEDRSDGLLQISVYAIDRSWRSWVFSDILYKYEFHIPQGSIQRNFTLN